MAEVILYQGRQNKICAGRDILANGNGMKMGRSASLLDPFPWKAPSGCLRQSPPFGN